jgi:hypothetical protein
MNQRTSLEGVTAAGAGAEAGAALTAVGEHRQTDRQGSKI